MDPRKTPKINNRISYILIVFVFQFNGDQCYECNYFDPLAVKVIRNLNFPERLKFPIIRGCFEPSQFNMNVDSITVDKKVIGILGDYAVYNLTNMKSLSFFNCDIRKISANAFVNLPSLEELWIADSKLTSIKSGTFKNLTSLESILLDGGKIGKIEPDAFGEGLKELSVEKNKISEINPMWFSNSPDIKSLFFSFNKIQRIKNQTFQFTPNLSSLYLSHNQIKYIENGSFQYLNSLEVLVLQHNKLIEFAPNIVPDNFRLKKFDLSSNILNFLSSNLLEKITVTTLLISGNPWECHCLWKIHEWIIESNIELENNCKLFNIPYCVFDKEVSTCSEKVNANITKSFLKELKGVADEHCANL